MKYSILFYIVVVFVLIIGLSCKKAKVDKIETTWKLIKISETQFTDNFEVWDFQGGGFYRLGQLDTLPDLDTLDFGEYEVDAGLTKTELVITECSDIIYNGNWHIMKLRSDRMVILNNRDNLFIYREFEKYQ